MLSSHHIGFGFSIIVMATILVLIPYNGDEVASKRLGKLLLSDISVTQFINHNCSEWEIADSSNLVKHVKTTLNVHLSKTLQKEICKINITYGKSRRFYVKDIFSYSLKISSVDFMNSIERIYQFNLPTPLTLLPPLALLIAIPFNCGFWGIGVTFVLLCFLISGGNLLNFFSTSKIIVLKAISEQVNIGIFFMIIWLCLYRSRKIKSPKTRWTSISQIGVMFFGLFDPIGYTLLGKLFLPFKQSVKKASNFLSIQVVIVAISLYLLSIDSKINLANLIIPRYFTFIMIFLILLRGVSLDLQKSDPWNFHLIISIFLGIGFELVSRYFTLFPQLGTLGRIALIFIIIEFIFFKGLSFAVTLKRMVPLVGMLFISSFVGFMASMYGITDLILELFSPHRHPLAISFIAFVCGILLGFFTGSFSISFFTFYPLIFSFSNIEEVRAALIDGVLAGSLLSPFSCLNLFVVVQNRIALHELLRFRAKLLSVPLIVGLIIYSISAINTMLVLQPVTFTFVCLIILAFHFKRRGWQI